MLDNLANGVQTENGSGLIRDGVYEKIRADILACILAPGARVFENDLAQRYNVSKSPVRDALLRLQEQGLIDVLPRKGYLIRPISIGDAHDLYEMRLLLEKSCIRRACDEASDEELASLDKFRSVENGDLAHWVTYNRDFHRRIAELSGNARMAKMAQEVIDQFDRLTFVLLGVARPADLIKDRTRTPYNIGTSVDVTDFQQDELQAFEDVLEQALSRQGRKVLRWALDWTGGQPYLTQKLCAEIIEQASGNLSERDLSELVENLFLGDKARTETNLRSIRDRTSGNPYVARMLRIYKKVLKGKEVVSKERSIEQNELKLTGLVKVNSQGNLLVRNRIYARTFDLAWTKDNTPVTAGQRMSVVLSVITVLALGFAGYFYYQQQNQAREVLAQTYTENFTTSASQEIRISGLAGLFELGDEYAVQGEELFNALGHKEQLALFDLETPENVGNELFAVTENLYQEQRNTSEGNKLLLAMAGVLEQTSAPGATSLTLEINAWLDGREQDGQENYTSAITFYTNAWEKSQQREQENSGILYDRGVAYAATEKYDPALKDFDHALRLDEDRASDIEITISENQNLTDYWRENSIAYPNLENTIVISRLFIPTPSPTSIPLVWEQVSTGQEFERDVVMGLGFDPSNQDILYIHMENAGSYKTIDGGLSWIPIQKDEIPDNIQFSSAIDKHSSHEAQYNTALDGKERKYKMVWKNWFVSEYNGENRWREISSTGDALSTALTFDSTGAVYTFCNYSICKFSPDGRDRNTLGLPNVGVVTVLAFSPFNQNILYAAGNGLAISLNGGLTWEYLNNGLGNQLLDLHTVQGDIPSLYIQAGDCIDTVNLGEYRYLIHPLYYSTDSGKTWTFTNQPGCYLIHDADSITLYRLGNSDSWMWIWRSPNGGKSWGQYTIPITTEGRLKTLAAHPSEKGWLLGVQHDDPFSKYISKDYGRTWEDATLVTDFCYGATVRIIDPHDSNHILSIENGYLKESYDGCNTGEVIGYDGLFYPVNAVAIDPNNPDIFYVGTDSGVYISFNGGENWEQINDGLLGTPITYSIVVDDEGNVYATTPNGIFKLNIK